MNRPNIQAYFSAVKG